MIPSAPNQDPAPATEMGQFSWPAEAPSALYDASAENASANPYFSPVGWTYKLRQDEALVLVGTLPPECKYFSLLLRRQARQNLWRAQLLPVWQR